MGEAARIAEMARHLMKLSGLEPGRDIDFVCTGLLWLRILSVERRTPVQID